jgi:hypothetical protein
MKSQCLQDAIKAQALKLSKARENGGWKEPVVKKHQVTADELRHARFPVSAPPVVAPITPSTTATRMISTPDVTKMNIEMSNLSVQLREQKESLERAVSELNEAKQETRELKSERQTSFQEFRDEMDKIQQRLHFEIDRLASQLEEAKNEIRSLQRDNVSLKGLQAEMAEIRELISSTHTSNSNKENSSTNYGSIHANDSNTNCGYYSTPTSPKKQRPPARMNPHTADEIVEAQRKDKVLREFMQTKQGLYDPKYMTIHEAANIVCFKRKIYVPASLRLATIRYYKSEYPSSEEQALEQLRKNCCWPELEKHFYQNKCESI